MISEKLIIVGILFSLIALRAHAVSFDVSACDENFEKVYLAKRSCVLNSAEESCRNLVNLSSLYPALGGVAGAGIAKIHNAFIKRLSNSEKDIEVKNSKIISSEAAEKWLKEFKSTQKKHEWRDFLHSQFIKWIFGENEESRHEPSSRLLMQKGRHDGRFRLGGDEI